MTLSDYIRAHGVDACAKTWRMKRRTVESWMRGERFPSRRHVQVILRTTPLTVQAIYQPKR